MACTLYTIDSVCGAVGGIRSMVITDMTNLAGYGPQSLPPASGTAPTFVDNDQVYAIAFERGSASFSAESASDQGGDYAVHQAVGFVPRSRLTVEVLIRRMRNRPVFVIAIDRYLNQHVIYDARLSYRHSTGAKYGDRHGYTLTWSGPSHYILPSVVGEGNIPSAPPEPGSGGGGGECCISVNPIPIGYTPAPTGNEANNNELVTTSDGILYFIDSSGRSVVINRPAHRVYREQLADPATNDYITIPSDFPLPDPADYPSPTYDTDAEMSRRLWVKLGSRWLAYAHAEGYTVDYATRRIYFETSVDGAFIEVYAYAGIDPIEL